MGLEAQCTARWDERVSEGKALLETDDILFRGDFRVRILLRDIIRVDDHEAELHINSPGGVLVLSLGAKETARWAERLRNPRTLLDKLGIQPGQHVLWCGSGIDGEEAREVRAQVAAKVAAVSDYREADETLVDLVFLFAESLEELGGLPELMSRLALKGGLWVVAPKGQRHLTELHVLQAGREAGLTDNKVARFSATHTAHKFVRRRSS